MSNIFKNMAAGSIPPTVATSYVTDSGTAVPAASVLNVVTPGGGTQGIQTTGAGNTITITLANTTLSGTATTTGNSTSVINVNVPLATNNSALSLRANIIGFDKTANLATGGEVISTVRNIGGVLTVVKTDRTENDDNNIHDATWNVITSGTNVQIQVVGTSNGINTDVIDWAAIIDFVTVS